ncbi:RHS repeat-associated core domain-containing protein, partial [Brevibacillus reuszeri]|uniref:RHS repeat-associated core domain-containing protein n=1 Tax=Brevibacillus reuszeri TaxID=54915 RepID=UPI0036702061
ISDGTGQELNSYAYDTWGNVISKTEGMSNPYQYSGEPYDEKTGFYYLRARYYDPKVGRFISEDTYKGAVDNPLTLNRYSYVHNNPIRYFDPTGNKAVEYASVGGGGGGVVLPVSPKEAFNIITFGTLMWAAAPKEAPQVTQSKPQLTVINGGQNANSNKSKPVGLPLSNEKENNKNDQTLIYRKGNDSPWNMTPRQKDARTGLSFQLTKPEGNYVVTTIGAINSSGILIAIKDGENHVSVKPVDGNLVYWASQRPNSGDPVRDSTKYNTRGEWNKYTTEMLKIIGSYSKWVNKKE